MTDTKDDIYAQQQSRIKDFIFDANVASVFPDMIGRSVPGYAAIINMIELLTKMHARPASNLYDLGCSLGASTLAMASGLTKDDCHIIAIDNAPAMIEQAKIKAKSCNTPIKFICGDLQNLKIENASVVVLNFTLQFLAIGQRDKLLADICGGLVPGGILILSEKILGEDQQSDAKLVEMHHAFKKANGYSDLEISQKRSSLENVLLPETLKVHQQRLLNAGFKRSDVWFQCFNFASLVVQA